MIDVKKIQDVLHSLEGISLNKEFFRLVLESDKAEILEIWPSQTHGWRFNPAGEFGALYLSESPSACAKEVGRHIPDVSAFKDRPRVLGTIGVYLQKCLDLTDIAVLSALGVTEDSVLEDDSAVAITVAREARRAGFEGVLYHSVVNPNFVNLALFKDCLLPRSSYQCISTENVSFDRLLSWVDGFAFLDVLNFDAFNEANQLNEDLKLHRERFGEKPDVAITDI